MIPHGLMTCYLDTDRHTAYEVRVLGLSMLGFTFRLPIGESPIGKEVRITVFELYKSATYSFVLTDARITADSRERFWQVYRLETESGEFKSVIGTFMREYSEYVQMKLCEDTPGIESAMCIKKSLDENYYHDIHTLREAWCSRLLLPKRWHMAKETAVMLDNPDITDDYLCLPFEAFCAKYKKIRGCDAECLDALNINCLYIGNEYCLHLLPDFNKLSSVFQKAHDEHLSAVLCLPPIPDQAIDRITLIVKQLLETFPLHEVVVNDWGMLAVLSDLKDKSLIKTLGVLLCKRHKDTRFDRLNGNALIPAQTSIDDPLFREQLAARFGKLHFSCESGFGAAPSNAGTVMYWPAAQLNTSEYCGLRAICDTGNRVLQKYESECPHYCRDHFLFYPIGSDMLGKYNTLFGYSNREELSDFERLVLTLP